MDAFKKGMVKILIATDINARGIDIPNVDYVINYDLPEQAENYVHRVGRTGSRGVSVIRRSSKGSACRDRIHSQASTGSVFLGRLQPRRVSKGLAFPDRPRRPQVSKGSAFLGRHPPPPKRVRIGQRQPEPMLREPRVSSNQRLLHIFDSATEKRCAKRLKRQSFQYFRWCFEKLPAGAEIHPLFAYITAIRPVAKKRL